MHRRNFLRQSSMGLAACSLMPLSLNAFDHVVAELNTYRAAKPGLSRVEDEAFWNIVRTAFRREGDFINLENGYFSPQPEPVFQSTW